MKDLPATRERKEQITAHFLGGGTAATLPNELKRVPIASIQACQVRAFQQKAKRRASEPVQ